jgi:two-component system, sensor histidine kinase
VQRVVRLLDLQLDISSEIGKGSVFTLSLQAGLERNFADEPHAQRAPVAASQLASQQHILLVEDDPAVRDATRMLLRVEGYRVTAVAGIAEALRKTEAETIDLLITDYHLEGDEVGTALISALRKKVGSATLKAVLVTGDTSSIVKDLPTDPYLRVASKPIRADALLTLLRTFLAS